MANEQAPRDQNQVPTLLAVDDTTGETRPVLVDEDGNLLIAATVAGGVVGPGSSTDNAIVLFDGTTGDLIKNSTTKIVAGVLSPTVNDAGQLGSGTLMWGDLFLADGGVINFNNGDVTLTHSANTLTLAGGVLAIPASSISINGNLMNLAGAFTTSGANTLVLTTTGSTNVTLPTTGTLATLAGAESLTNKKLGSLTSNGIVTTSAGDGTLSVTATIGSGNVVLATGPTLVTPVLGAATATSINGLTITSSTGTLTITNGKTLSASNTLTFTGTDSSSVAFGTGGTVAYTNVTTLSSLVSVGTITTGTWNATDVAVTAGGTGLSTLTANNVILGNGTSTPLFVAPSTSGNVLTSNGTTWVSSAPSASARRNLNANLVISNMTTAGNAPTNATSINGIQCSVAGVDGGSSIGRFETTAVANWDFYDKNPEFNVNIAYTAGSDTGSGDVWAGDSSNNSPPPVTLTEKSMFILGETTTGTTTWSAVNANGTTNTNTTMSGITATDENLFRVVKNSTTNIKFYCNYTLKATHTTNLPSGDTDAVQWMTFGSKNDAGDTTTRTCRYGYFDCLLDSPTG